MVGKTKDTLFRNVLSDMFEIVGEGNYSYNISQGIIKMYGRTIFVVGANDEKAETRIRGMTLAGAYCDEVTLYPQSFFVQLLARCSVRGARIYVNCNPDSPYHWFAKDYLQDETLREKGIVKSWHFTMDDNLSLDPEYKESLKALYKGLFYKRNILGLWVNNIAPYIRNYIMKIALKLES